MKTDFLKGFGLDDDAIAKILAQAGKDIEAEKAKAKPLSDEVEALKQSKAELEEKVAALGANAQNTDDLNAKIKELQEDLDKRKADDEKAKAEAELKSRFEAVSKEKNFVNDITRNGVMSEFVTVGRKKELTVTFRDGTEIEA